MKLMAKVRDKRRKEKQSSKTRQSLQLKNNQNYNLEKVSSGKIEKWSKQRNNRLKEVRARCLRRKSRNDY